MSERAEPPIDGDRETARKLNAEARQQPLGVDISDFSDEWCEGYLNGQDGVLTFIELVMDGTMANFQQASLVAPWLSYIASLGAAEPPSAPAPCPTNHKTVGGDKWDMPRHYTVKGEVVMWRPKFCPDCGAPLGVPEGEEA